ncbi:hypothetical protein KI688_005790 [Linnemannia hyalina]|uniref:Uncharacterized protein n=1 Tax=Linnemannia hyalina TaxID=64524 RepID=A0A9P7Y4E2_9FUNG|nr:hypothetical protein KI688_005790 [Linnemannia hyalina]
MATLPSYVGTTAVLPVDVIAFTYFKITKISEWGLEGFFTSTGLTELEFVSSLKDISRIIQLPSDISDFREEAERLLWSTGKQTAARTPQTSNKKRSGITKARDEYVGLEEGLDSDEHDDTSDETVVAGLKVTKSMRAGNEGKTVASDNDNGNDQDDDEDDEDGNGEETVEDLIQELQSLQEDVAISGIVDLDVHKDFPQHADLLSECRAAIELQYPKIHDHLQTYRQFMDDDDGLMEARLGELMNQLKKDMSRFEDDSDEMVTAEILQILEETVLKEAQQDQLAVRKVVGARAAKGAAGASGRGLDFRLVASIRKARKFIPFTLCNNEHKAPDTTPQFIKIQYRKNMRLNKSIAMNGWIPRETSTMFLYVVGFVGDWNIITHHGDVILSCQVQDEPLILTANAFEM